MYDINKILEIKTNNVKPIKGRILISEPFLLDFFFKRSVVLLADHSIEGSFGVIVNKPINFKLNEIIKDFPDFGANVYLGGPIKTDSLFYLHTLGSKIEGSEKIMDGLYWGGELESVKEQILLNNINFNQIRFFVGYSGWAPNQLDDEIKKDAWVISNASINDVLTNKPNLLWNESVDKLGFKYSLWSNFPVDPSLN